jgi:hypothetical protein
VPAIIPRIEEAAKNESVDAPFRVDTSIPQTVENGDVEPQDVMTNKSKPVDIIPKTKVR